MDFNTNSDLELQPLQTRHLQPLVSMGRRSIDLIKPWLGEGLAPTDDTAALQLIEKFNNDAADDMAYGFVLKDKHNSHYLGFGFLNNINRTHKFCNLGYWIDNQATGRGYATLATQKLIEFGIHKLGLKRIELVIEPHNNASIRVAQKVGCQNEGLLKNRIWGEKDAYMYAYCV